MSTRRQALRAGAAGAATVAGATTIGRAATAAGAAEPARKPNILILMCDQERLPQWTPDLPLPARDWIDRRGVSFERFHHSAVQCSSSRACFWTGMYTPQNGIFGNFLQSWQFSLDPRIPTIGDLMHEQGYTTAFFGKWHLSMAGVSVTEGAVENVEGNYLGSYGFDYSDQSLSAEPAGYNDGVYNDPIWTKQGVDWLHEHGGQEKPWLTVVSLLNPHDIAYFPRGFSADVKRPDWGVELPLNFEDDITTKPTVHRQYANGAALVRGGIAADDKTTWRRLMNTYCDLIVNTDDNLAAVVKALHASGGMDDTVIIRCADHGEMGGSHRAAGKGPMIYDEQLRMPLSISWPARFGRAGAGSRTRALSDSVDIIPTCLELAGLEDPVARYPWLRGTSLVSALDDPAHTKGKDFTVSTCDEVWSPQDFAGQGKPWKRHVRAALSGHFKVARYVAMAGKPQRELTDDQDYEVYDLSEDPYELRNLARDPAYKPLLDDLLARLRELEDEHLSPVKVPDYGHSSLTEALRPDPYGRPDTLDGVNSPPSPVEGVPGAYVQAPYGDPHIWDRVYDGGDTGHAPLTADGSRAMAEARAQVRATMLCELGPVTKPS
jgi:arylsulfatase A-like enzyme